MCEKFAASPDFGKERNILSMVAFLLRRRSASYGGQVSHGFNPKSEVE
jgi:hypothetical protein